MKALQRYFPWIMLAFAITYCGSKLIGTDQSASGYDLRALGQLPVSSGGRTKPLDTVARNSLMAISGRQSLRDQDEQVSAIQWYIDLVTDPQVTVTRNIFRIDHPEVLALLGLNEEKRTRFSYEEIQPKIDEIWRQAGLADQTKAKARDPFQRGVLTLYRRVVKFHNLSQLTEPYLVPPLTASQDWRPLNSVLMSNPSDPDGLLLLRIFEAYSDENPALFNSEVENYAERIGVHLGSQARKARYEVVFNDTQPFYAASVLYIMAFLVGCIGLLLSQLAKPDWSTSMRRSMLAFIAVAFIVQTIGIASRVYLQGRPPVTNLYSSAVFIGWISVMLGVFIDRQTKLGLGGIMASAIGFGTLVIAHNLGGSGDTMEMMQAVLDSNFWLATHVVVVTIGYSATFFAGFLAIAYLMLGVFTPIFDRERGASLSKMIYGVICFAALMSFIGTVLGGIWADQSWGRFWGWDPKENGAALIVFMNLLIMHARWGGMVRDRGVAVLAVGGNIITAWSWFGTNMLGVGLHSYGFTESAVFWFAMFVLSQLVLMAIGMLPLKFWRSKFLRAPRAELSTSLPA